MSTDYHAEHHEATGKSGIVALLMGLLLPGLGFVYLGRPWIFALILIGTLAMGFTMFLIPVAVIVWIGAAVMAMYIAGKPEPARPDDLAPADD